MTAADRRGTGLVVAAGAALLLAATLYLASAGVPPFHTWSYQLSWYPYLLLLDGAHAWRTGRFALLGRPAFAASLFLWSAPVWFVFEVLNFRLANWFYVSVPDPTALRWPGYVVAFATVLPAVYLPERWLRLRLGDGDITGPAIPVGATGRRAALAAGVLFVLLPMWRPSWFYPLVWGATALLLEPWNHLRDPENSLLGDLERGRYGRIVRLLLAGLAAGILWETMNAAAGARWIYTVPGFETVKIFEMPPPGFIGFTVFGLECWVMYRALVNAGVAVAGWDGARPRDARAGGAAPAGRGPALSPGRTWAAALLAAVFCVGASLGVDRWTVASRRPGLDELPGASAETSDALRAAGIEGVAGLAGADSLRIPALAPELDRASAGRLVRLARMAELRGLGARNAALLHGAGIDGVCALAEAGDQRVARLLGEVQPVGPGARARRARVWIRAAREACPTASR